MVSPREEQGNTSPAIVRYYNTIMPVCDSSVAYARGMCVWWCGRPYVLYLVLDYTASSAVMLSYKSNMCDTTALNILHCCFDADGQHKFFFT